jgi:hypothetical protein
LGLQRYDLEEYPIDLAGIFQDHINPSLQKGFRTHYPLYGQTRSRTAITQRNILTDMLTALIKAENDISNIKDIIRGEQGGGEQFHSATAQSNPSVAEKTLRKSTATMPPRSAGILRVALAWNVLDAAAPNTLGCTSPESVQRPSWRWVSVSSVFDPDQVSLGNSRLRVWCTPMWDKNN